MHLFKLLVLFVFLGHLQGPDRTEVVHYLKQPSQLANHSCMTGSDSQNESCCQCVHTHLFAQLLWFGRLGTLVHLSIYSKKEAPDVIKLDLPDSFSQ